MKKPYLSRRESIILTSIEILDQLGVQGLTIREIAHRQEVTEAAIYRHFKSKQEIILSILDQFARYDSVIMNTVREQNYTPIDGIKFVIKSFAEYYENYPEITSVIFSYEMFRYEPEAINRIKEIYRIRQEFLSDLIKAAQNRGEINSKFDCWDFAILIQGFVNEMTNNWRISGCVFSLKDKLVSNTELLLS